MMCCCTKSNLCWYQIWWCILSSQCWYYYSCLL